MKIFTVFIFLVGMLVIAKAAGIAPEGKPKKEVIVLAATLPPEIRIPQHISASRAYLPVFTKAGNAIAFHSEYSYQSRVVSMRPP